MLIGVIGMGRKDSNPVIRIIKMHTEPVWLQSEDPFYSVITDNWRVKHSSDGCLRLLFLLFTPS